MFFTNEDKQFLKQFDDPAVWLSHALDLECTRMTEAGWIELGVCDHKPGVNNWVEKRGGLPNIVNRIAKHLVEKGMSCGHAIGTAINAVKKTCGTNDLNFPGIQHATAKTMAEYCGGATQWQAIKGGAG